MVKTYQDSLEIDIGTYPISVDTFCSPLFTWTHHSQSTISCFVRSIVENLSIDIDIYSIVCNYVYLDSWFGMLPLLKANKNIGKRRLSSFWILEPRQQEIVHSKFSSGYWFPYFYKTQLPNALSNNLVRMSTSCIRGRENASSVFYIQLS